MNGSVADGEKGRKRQDRGIERERKGGSRGKSERGRARSGQTLEGADEAPGAAADITHHVRENIIKVH